MKKFLLNVIHIAMYFQLQIIEVMYVLQSVSINNKSEIAK